MRKRKLLSIILVTIVFMSLNVFPVTAGKSKDSEFPYPITEFKTHKLTGDMFRFRIQTAESVSMELLYGPLEGASLESRSFPADTSFSPEIPLLPGDNIVQLNLTSDNIKFTTSMILRDEQGTWRIENPPRENSEYFSESGVHSMAVVSESEPNNTTNAANSLAAENDMNGLISSTADVDYFKFTITPYSYVNVFLGQIPSGTNYDLYLYNISGTQVAKSTNVSNANELISEKLLNPGTYYIKVASASGSSTTSKYLLRWRLVKAWPTIPSTKLSRGFSSTHDGIDILPKTSGVAGDDVLAFYDGTVNKAGFVTRPDGSPSYGWVVYIDHTISGYSVRSIYAHLHSAPLVSAGNTVKAGKHIGEMGTSGNSTGVHLHFETRKSGTPVNPLTNYFPGILVSYATVTAQAEPENYSLDDLVYYPMEEIAKMTPQERKAKGIPLK